MDGIDGILSVPFLLFSFAAFLISQPIWGIIGSLIGSYYGIGNHLKSLWEI